MYYNERVVKALEKLATSWETILLAATLLWAWLMVLVFMIGLFIVLERMRYGC